MPLFDVAIKAVTTAYAEYTCLTPEITKSREALRTLDKDKDHVSSKLKQLNRLGDIKALNHVQTQLSSIETQLDELVIRNEEIQDQLNKLSKIELSNPEERRQLAAQEIIYPQVKRFAKLLGNLQTVLDTMHNQSPKPNNIPSSSGQTAYMCMMEIIRLETVLTKHHHNEINNDLKQIIDNSPVAKIFKNSRSFTPWQALIDHDQSQAQKHNLSTEKDLADKETTRLGHLIKQLKDTINQNQSEEERTLPETKSRLEQERWTIDKTIQSRERSKQAHQGIIAAFDIIPKKAESLTEKDITAYREDLGHELAVINQSIKINQTQLNKFEQQSSDAYTNTTMAIKALQNQYDLCAGSLIALTTCTVVTLVLLEVFTLTVAPHVLLISVAAVGLWHYNQTTDPEALSNISPTVP
ncbi:MAG: hypothetical protein P1U36_00115 [Legionellaceae bacterium]|nr:hypothetical protein [Legionellaceae bacterium]